VGNNAGSGEKRRCAGENEAHADSGHRPHNLLFYKVLIKLLEILNLKF
jgi:hypothetical protein